MKILLTGFNSFRRARVNPSEQVVRALATGRRNISGVELVTAVLPTEYLAATRQLRRLIRSSRPDAILCLGVATWREHISLERVALNLDDERTPDNRGLVRRDRKIVPHGPDVYWSSLPLERLQTALQEIRLRAEISNHAGAFLCNHAFYVARHETAQLRRPVPCGFIHLPGIGHGKARRKYSREQLTRAVEACLRELEQEAVRAHRQKKRKGYSSRVSSSS
jgi:pyroglutamyl-peptidase